LQRTYFFRRPYTRTTGVPARPPDALDTSGAAAAVATFLRNAASTTIVAADIKLAVLIVIPLILAAEAELLLLLLVLSALPRPPFGLGIEARKSIELVRQPT
jgi:hypothetical protein